MGLYYLCVRSHLFAKDDRSPSMSSSGTKPLSLSEFLFQTKARVRPKAAPSLRILSTRYCPEAHVHTHTHTHTHTHRQSKKCTQHMNAFKQNIHKDLCQIVCVEFKRGSSDLDARILQLQSSGRKSWLPCPALRTTKNIHLQLDNTNQKTHTNMPAFDLTSYLISLSLFLATMPIDIYCSTHQIISQPSRAVCHPTWSTTTGPRLQGWWVSTVQSLTQRGNS